MPIHGGGGLWVGVVCGVWWSVGQVCRGRGGGGGGRGGVGALHPPRALVSPGDPVPGGPVALHAAIALHV